MTRCETTDGKFVQIDVNEWWATVGVDIVDQSVVDAHLDANPQVGIVVLVSSQ